MLARCVFLVTLGLGLIVMAFAARHELNVRPPLPVSAVCVTFDSGQGGGEFCEYR